MVKLVAATAALFVTLVAVNSVEARGGCSSCGGGSYSMAYGSYGGCPGGVCAAPNYSTGYGYGYAYRPAARPVYAAPRTVAPVAPVVRASPAPRYYYYTNTAAQGRVW